MWGSGTLDIYYLLLLQRYNKYKKNFLIKLIYQYNPRENADMSNEKGITSP